MKMKVVYEEECEIVIREYPDKGFVMVCVEDKDDWIAKIHSDGTMSLNRNIDSRFIQTDPAFGHIKIRDWDHG